MVDAKMTWLKIFKPLSRIYKPIESWQHNSSPEAHYMSTPSDSHQNQLISIIQPNLNPHTENHVHLPPPTPNMHATPLRQLPIKLTLTTRRINNPLQHGAQIIKRDILLCTTPSQIQRKTLILYSPSVSTPPSTTTPKRTQTHQKDTPPWTDSPTPSPYPPAQ